MKHKTEQEKIEKVYELRSQGFGRDKMHLLTGIPVRFISKHMKEYDAKHKNENELAKIKEIHRLINEGKSKASIHRMGYSKLDIVKYSKCDSLDKRTLSERIRQEVSQKILKDGCLFNWQIEDIIYKHHIERDCSNMTDMKFVRRKRDAIKNDLVKKSFKYGLAKHQAIAKSDWMSEHNDPKVIKQEDNFTKDLNKEYEEYAIQLQREVSLKLSKFKKDKLAEYNNRSKHKMDEDKFKTRMEQLNNIPSIADISFIVRKQKTEKKYMNDSIDKYTAKVITAMEITELVAG